MGKLTPHFREEEFRSKDQPAVPSAPGWPLLVVLEQIRAHCKRPVVIVSGYRTPARNRAVGGAADSRHLHGDAADIPAGLVSPADAVRFGATGVGVTADGLWAVHVDVRPLGDGRWPSDRFVSWRYGQTSTFRGDTSSGGGVDPAGSC